MQNTSRTKVIKQFTHILNLHHFHSKTLQPISLDSFSEMVDALANTIIPFNSSQSQFTPADRMSMLMEVLTKQQEELTLNSVTKKMVILFTLLRKMAQEETLDQPIQTVFFQQINSLLKEELLRVGLAKQKKASSISKIYSYIRELSGSKEKPSEGRTVLQSDKDKGGIKEIVSAIFQPFCCYMLRMLQKHDTYSIILKRTGSSDSSLLWTMANSAQCLGQIVSQLHRFSRYFINDLLGILLYLTLCVCKDISLYYDALAGELGSQAAEWRRLIEENSMEIHDGAENSVFQSVSFQQTKGLIDQFLAIREKIHYIFGNKSFKNYKNYFAKPSKYSLREDVNAQSLQFIQEYHKKAAKRQQQTRSLNVVDKKTGPYLFIASSEPFLSSESLNHTPGTANFGNELEYKLANAMPCKPRMNNWLNRSQRSKHAKVGSTITACKDDPISTSSND